MQQNGWDLMDVMYQYIKYVTKVHTLVQDLESSCCSCFNKFNSLHTLIDKEKSMRDIILSNRKSFK